MFCAYTQCLVALKAQRRTKQEVGGWGGGHAVAGDCFVGTNSVAQLCARADGFNYFRLKLNRARRV